MSKFNVNVLIANKNTRLHLNTLLQFTTRRSAENVSYKLADRNFLYKDANTLFVALRENDANPSAILDKLIDSCIDIVDESPVLNDDQRQQLLQALTKHPFEKYDNAAQVVALLTVIGITIGTIASAVSVSNNSADKDASLKAAVLIFIGIVLDAIFMSCVCGGCRKSDQLTATPEIFECWLEDVSAVVKQLQKAHNIPKLSPLSSKDANAISIQEIEMSDTEMDPLQTNIQPRVTPI